MTYSQLSAELVLVKVVQVVTVVPAVSAVVVLAVDERLAALARTLRVAVEPPGFAELAAFVAAEAVSFGSASGS